MRYIYFDLIGLKEFVCMRHSVKQQMIKPFERCNTVEIRADGGYLITKQHNCQRFLVFKCTNLSPAAV